MKVPIRLSPNAAKVEAYNFMISKYIIVGKKFFLALLPTINLFHLELE